MPSVIKAAKKGDAAIIKSIINILNYEDIKVISSIYFNPELSLKSGNYTKFKPNKDDLLSIKVADGDIDALLAIEDLRISKSISSI